MFKVGDETTNEREWTRMRKQVRARPMPAVSEAERCLPNRDRIILVR